MRNNNQLTNDIEIDEYVNEVLKELPEDQRYIVEKTIKDFKELIQVNIVDNLNLLLSINKEEEVVKEKKTE